jgi:hypothetical protein
MWIQGARKEIQHAGEDGMTPYEQHKLIEKILWGLKIPEVLATCFIIGGIILLIAGAISYVLVLYAALTRTILIFVRIGIVIVKRRLERKYNLAKITYVPTIIKKGTKKVEFVTRYK